VVSAENVLNSSLINVGFPSLMGIKVILSGLFGFLLRRGVTKRGWLALGLVGIPLLLSLPSCITFFQFTSDLDVVYTPLPLSYPLYLELRKTPLEIYPPVYVVRLFFVLEVYSFTVQSESVYALTLDFFPLFYLLNLVATVAGGQLSKLKRTASSVKGKSRFKQTRLSF